MFILACMYFFLFFIDYLVNKDVYKVLVLVLLTEVLTTSLMQTISRHR